VYRRGCAREISVTDELDGVLAAPDHHRVLFENDEVRVVETTIRAGDRTPLHTHLRQTVSYVLSGSHFLRRDEAGEPVFDTRSDPSFVLPRVLFSQPIQRHTLENTGGDDLVLIGVELKREA
jgi:mannose-6-phosphate isomerase-like protein (cupin superfamily)